MSTGKTVSIRFWASSDPKAKLEAVVAKENRSLTNMLESLILDYWQRGGVMTKILGAMGEGEGKR